MLLNPSLMRAVRRRRRPRAAGGGGGDPPEPTVLLMYDAGDAGLSVTRASTAHSYSSAGVVESAAINTARDAHFVAGEQTLLLEDAATNLAPSPESFDAAGWTAERSTVTANAIAAPDGAITAEKVVEDTTLANTHSVRFTDAVARVLGQMYVLSVFVKAGERSRFQLNLGGTDWQTGNTGIFDLSTGTVTGGDAVHRNIRSLADGWFRVEVGDVATATTPRRVQMFLRNDADQNTYDGDGVSGLYVWGAQYEAADRATSYINGTRAADSASFASSWESLEVTQYERWYDPATADFTDAISVFTGTAPAALTLGRAYSDVRVHAGSQTLQFMRDLDPINALHVHTTDGAAGLLSTVNGTTGGELVIVHENSDGSPATYDVGTSELAPAAGVTIRAASPASIGTDGAITASVIITGTGSRVIDLNGIDNVTLEDLDLAGGVYAGSVADPSGQTGNVIRAHCDGLTMRRCRVRDSENCGLTGQVTGLLLEDCQFTNNSTAQVAGLSGAIKLASIENGGAAQNVARRVLIDNNDFYGWWLDCQMTNGALVEDLIVRGNFASGIFHETVDGVTTYLRPVIEGNNTSGGSGRGGAVITSSKNVSLVEASFGGDNGTQELWVREDSRAGQPRDGNACGWGHFAESIDLTDCDFGGGPVNLTWQGEGDQLITANGDHISPNGGGVVSFTGCTNY